MSMQIYLKRQFIQLVLLSTLSFLSFSCQLVNSDPNQKGRLIVIWGFGLSSLYTVTIYPFKITETSTPQSPVNSRLVFTVDG